MHLIIQIPSYNEERTLERTVGELPRRIEGVDVIEYLVVNDGSKDGTVEAAERAGVHHIVSFKRNRGLARGFAAGIDACLRLGADIIVNTDADNQYCGEDVEKLVRPILDGKADIVIGARPIEQTAHFSPLKKKFQRFGSWVVRVASNTDIPDAPSGFRAYSREAALRLNIINEYTYTLETIIQAGRNKTAIASVPIRTNPETRKSRLFKSMWTYMRRSASVIVRAFLMYKPLTFFCMLSLILFVPGFCAIVRFLWFHFLGQGGGHIQSLIIAVMLVMLGALCVVIGLQADLIAANRKILEDIQYRVRKSEVEKGTKTSIADGNTDTPPPPR
jgi:glycosyltransferase involved in cell wall biosynthesis